MAYRHLTPMVFFVLDDFFSLGVDVFFGPDFFGPDFLGADFFALFQVDIFLGRCLWQYQLSHHHKVVLWVPASA